VPELDIPDLLAWLIVLGIAVNGTAKMIDAASRAYTAFRTKRTEIERQRDAELAAKVEEILTELRPNTGESFYDLAARIDAKVDTHIDDAARDAAELRYWLNQLDPFSPLAEQDPDDG